MSIATELSRIQTDRNTIRTKLVELGLATNTANLDALATAIAGIEKCGAVSISVKEGDTYTIPAGMHDGTGTVSGVSGGGNYTLQNKTVTPTKKQQSITSDDGYYGLSGVAVEAIPDNYQDVSSVTAVAGNVLTGKIFVTADGTVTTGAMKNNGAQNITAKPSSTASDLTIKAGYHSGSGKVSVSAKGLEVAPTKQIQSFSSGDNYYHSVTVGAIPPEYQNVIPVNATASTVLTGSRFVSLSGDVVEGTMPDNGEISKTLNTGTTSYTIPAGYTSGGEVSITTETKTATPTKKAQDITPSTGKVLSKVTVDPIPAAYQDVTKVTATPGQVLSSAAFVDSSGVLRAGTMINNGDFSGSMDGLTENIVGFGSGYYESITVTLTSDIEDALAAI